ncbi:hypothetical protein A3A63_00885 [Candidatus Gottesmanbacteria bacterium RIFCSPLOWO2_01_FULL_46_9]|uniref:Glycosyltransferase subfamily 4-like N-terminal domain-containing protein n=1 Tax=Candidatus Gottesmanbacteria bacterium RIFCSPLOWO2_01_FULL_46_9 TaxID=1798394 RepID=A0A1F6AZR7_9BACT|nr:MAG: hypothetical protein A3A63_00885 [Candidatus Gottesmanbacteria bacterium RIFCSPLOWO2_01_FULL_46_9]
MNILIVTEEYAIGGTSTYLRNLIAALHACHIKTFLITQGQKQPTIMKSDHIHIKLEYAWRMKTIPRRTWATTRALHQMLRIYKFTPDIVLTDLCLPALSYILCRYTIPVLRTVPIYYQFHGSFTLEHHDSSPPGLMRDLRYNLRLAIEHFTLNKARSILCFSSYAKKILHNIIQTTTPIIMTHPGVDPVIIQARHINKSKARNILGISHTKPIILLASRLDEKRKAVDQFFSLLQSKKRILNESVIVLCANLENAPQKFYQMLRDIPSRYSIYLVHNPSRATLGLWYRASDVVVLPSVSLETFGFVTLEAYSVGTSVIAYDIGANRELIESDWLAPVANKYALLEIIQKNLQLNKAEKNILSKNLIKKSMPFTWEAYLQTILDF